MKQKVIIFTGKHHRISGCEGNQPKNSYDEAALNDKVGRIFPMGSYDVDIVDYPESKMFCNINDIWKNVRTPILIGYKEGASYIEPIKNYSRKYLISPFIFPNGSNEPRDTDEYDEENTVCLFGGDRRSVSDAKRYVSFYPHTYHGLADGLLDLCSGLEQVGIFTGER